MRRLTSRSAYNKSSNRTARRSEDWERGAHRSDRGTWVNRRCGRKGLQDYTVRNRETLPSTLADARPPSKMQTSPRRCRRKNLPGPPLCTRRNQRSLTRRDCGWQGRLVTLASDFIVPVLSRFLADERPRQGQYRARTPAARLNDLRQRPRHAATGHGRIHFQRQTLASNPSCSFRAALAIISTANVSTCLWSGPAMLVHRFNHWIAQRRAVHVITSCCKQVIYRS
jgi:hypothetical protein